MRITFDGAGAVVGVVEQVRTGRKERAQTIADISRVIAAMVVGEPAAGTDE